MKIKTFFIVLVIVLAVYFIWRWRSKKAKDLAAQKAKEEAEQKAKEEANKNSGGGGGSNSGGGGGSNSGGGGVSKLDTPLSKADKETVKEAQTEINSIKDKLKLSFEPLKIDGSFGTKSKSALLEIYQKVTGKSPENDWLTNKVTLRDIEILGNP